MGIEQFPDEYVWAKSWQHLGMSSAEKLLVFTVNIALRAQSPDYEAFRPFLRRMIARYPVPQIKPGRPDGKPAEAGRSDPDDVGARGISEGSVRDEHAVGDLQHEKAVSVRAPSARVREGRGAARRREIVKRARLDAKHK